MGTRRQLQAGAFFALACVLSLAAAPARAGNPIIARYAPGDQVRNVYFDPSAPTGKFRKRIADAAATWRKLPGVERFEVHKSPSMALSPDPCADQDGVPIGGILRGPVAGSGTLAENRSCIDSETGRLIGFRQTYNKRMKFYMGSGEPPAKKFDLQAVATHELGHSEGWTGDHFSNRNNSKLCGNRSKQATMCPANYSGTKRLRTLTKDDKQPVINAYSQPSTVALDALGLRAPAGPGFLIRRRARRRRSPRLPGRSAHSDPPAPRGRRVRRWRRKGSGRLGGRCRYRFWQGRRRLHRRRSGR